MRLCDSKFNIAPRLTLIVPMCGTELGQKVEPPEAEIIKQLWPGVYEKAGGLYLSRNMFTFTLYFCLLPVRNIKTRSAASTPLQLTGIFISVSIVHHV